MQPRVVVVGAGAAGIIAAWRAACLGARVVLLEKTNRIGTKILISGGGKCNVAHAGSIEEVLSAFRPEEARFLRPACYRFRNDQVVEMFTARGLRVYTRPDGRIFPVDQTAKDVVAILRSCLEEAGVEARLESPVKGLIVEEGGLVGVRVGTAMMRKGNRPRDAEAYKSRSAGNLLKELEPIVVVPGDEGERLEADAVILCCGGCSYPNSGTTGDGWPWARDLGHSVLKVRAALAPLYIQSNSSMHVQLAGVSLRDVKLRARQAKEIASWTGDLLFTHQGISGPCALGVSRCVAEQLESAPVTLLVDLQPDRTFEEVDAALLGFAQSHPTQRITSFLERLVPDRVAGILVANSEVPAETIGARFDKKSRRRLANILKSWPLGEVRHVPLEKGEVVAGGVALDEVDPKTMRSSKMGNLFLCGEILDIAGPVGGYNLQAAFATGFVAGESASKIFEATC